ncbi:MAG: GSCFA domain-containing protein [Bacteroidota bacterium]|nr:GSCFA domain-containing protein [Bacteroidota bacterium]
MKFRTEIIPKKISDFQFDVNSKIYLIGSCFSENIGNLLTVNKFESLSNPFGTIYNPYSIADLINPAKNIDENLISSNEEIWFSFQMHSKIHETTKQEFLGLAKQIKDSSNKFIQRADYLIITLGSEWVYQLKSNQQIVANCHKMPSDLFEKKLLTVDESVLYLKEGISQIRIKNPDLKVIVTISPVRHIKDTIELNSVSKSISRIVCHELQNNLENCNYFPAYEILMDDLRDYRFYTSDLIHPNEQAVDYIWQFFRATYFSDKANEFVGKWTEAYASLQHRPFNPNSKSHQLFLKQLLTKLESLSELKDLRNEIAQVQSQIK